LVACQIVGMPMFWLGKSCQFFLSALDLLLIVFNISHLVYQNDDKLVYILACQTASPRARSLYFEGAKFHTRARPAINHITSSGIEDPSPRRAMSDQAVGLAGAHRTQGLRGQHSRGTDKVADAS